jgi:hypothetical protein
MSMKALFSVASHALLIATATSLASPACTDPVHDQEVSALGPEYPGVPPSAYHRAGQPCTVCHGPEGPAKTQFSVAGTIFWQPYQALTKGGVQSSIGANNVTVSLVDDNARQTQVVTNCVGNFWITPQDFPAAFPLEAAVYGPDGVNNTMGVNLISRAGSCATCHADPPNYNALGHIYLTPTAQIPSDQSSIMCPVDPNLADQGSTIP